MVALEARNEMGRVWQVTMHKMFVSDQDQNVRAPSPPLSNPPASPLYDALATNIPHPVMGFSSFCFEPSTPLFPPAHLVLRYLQCYADHFNLTKYIRFNECVEEASWDGQSWNVRVAGGTTQQFDRVVLPNGHYHTPRYPAILAYKVGQILEEHLTLYFIGKLNHIEIRRCLSSEMVPQARTSVQKCPLLQKPCIIPSVVLFLKILVISNGKAKSLASKTMGLLCLKMAQSHVLTTLTSPQAMSCRFPSYHNFDSVHCQWFPLFQRMPSILHTSFHLRDIYFPSRMISLVT